MVEKRICVVSDVDGCLTDGNFIYTVDGKVAKIFGPHDNDGVKLLAKNDIKTVFISADSRGFPITKKRIEDMKCEIYQVSEKERLHWIRNYKAENNIDVLIFFGDGIADAKVKNENACTLFVSPENARPEAKAVANHVTEHRGGQGAFLDLAIWVCKMFNKTNKLY